MKTVNVSIGDGGRIQAFTDPTQTVEYKQRAERRDSMLKERTSVKRPTSNETALERELMAQVSGRPSTQNSVSPRLAAEYAAFQTKQHYKSPRESQFEQELFNQISNAGKRHCKTN